MLSAAGFSANAQTATPASAGGDGSCGAVCRFFSGQWAPHAPPAAAQAQPEAAEPPRPRRSRAASAGSKQQSAVRRELASARARTRAAIAAGDVEQTSSVSRDQSASGARKSGELVLAAGPDDAHAAIAADLAAVVSPEIRLRTTPAKALPLKEVLSGGGADLAIASTLAVARGSAIADKVVYVSKLFTEELHAVAPPGVRRLDELQGK
ncbi:MAG TPA: hypothetical protein VHN20_06800, partial [Beijerinckiaceae bacterium]|nr:hypothetical protein [Beijerinckiaceae bacterium]